MQQKLFLIGPILILFLYYEVHKSGIIKFEFKTMYFGFTVSDPTNTAKRLLLKISSLVLQQNIPDGKVHIF